MDLHHHAQANSVQVFIRRRFNARRWLSQCHVENGIGRVTRPSLFEPRQAQGPKLEQNQAKTRKNEPPMMDVNVPYAVASET